jgi:uncharacterized membrane protein YhiD involved in acid resistance
MTDSLSFTDIFKTGALEKITAFSWLDMGIVLALSFLLGLLILYVYKKTYQGVMMSRSFGISLVALTLITSLIIMAITSNIILSLGMVGALSIVRFRSAIKEPMDIAFLFWAISAGIVVGAGLIPMAVFGSLFIGLVLVLFSGKQGMDSAYLLVLRCRDNDCEQHALDVVGKHVKKHAVKSKTVSGTGIEMTVEIRLSQQTTQFVNAVAAVPGVESAVLVSYHGEFAN